MRQESCAGAPKTGVGDRQAQVGFLCALFSGEYLGRFMHMVDCKSARNIYNNTVVPCIRRLALLLFLLRF